MSESAGLGSEGNETEDPIKEATIRTLTCVLDPLLDLMLDAGITVQEFNRTVRERAVRAAIRRVKKETGRESKSRVAIITGLPRSEVTKILKSHDSQTGTKTSQHPARRVLAAWYDSPHFGTQSGEPAVLPIFGKKRSFERLVDKYGSGIPVRAMLDELTQMNAIERLADQKLRVKARVPIMTGLTSRSVAAIGERTRDLLNTLTRNLKQSSKPLFEATALIDESDMDMVSVVRREITEQGQSFINSATSLLNRSQKKRTSKSLQPTTRARLGVTVYYFQDEIPNQHDASTSAVTNRRKNLRRHAQKAKRVTSALEVK